MVVTVKGKDSQLGQLSGEGGEGQEAAGEAVARAVEAALLPPTLIHK